MSIFFATFIGSLKILALLCIIMGRERFHVAMEHILKSKEFRYGYFILLAIATFSMLALAFLAGMLKISQGQTASGILVAMAVTFCAIGYGWCNYRLART